MSEEIEKAIKLLVENDYFVRKMPNNIGEEAEQCSEDGCGDCSCCNCFVCMIGNDD